MKKYYEMEGLELPESKEMYKSPNLTERYHHMRRMQWVKKLLKLMSDHLFLDVGCGRGYYVAFASNLAKRAIGTDIARTKLSNAKKLTKDSSKKVDFVVCDAGRLPFNENSFHYVLCSEVIEHLLKPWKALEELMRVSSKFIILTTVGPGHAGYKRLLRRSKSVCLIPEASDYFKSQIKKQKFGGGHMWYLSPRDIAEVLRNFGLSITSIIGSGAAYFPLQSKLLESAYQYFSKVFFLVDEVIDRLPLFRYTGKYTVIKCQKIRNE